MKRTRILGIAMAVTFSAPSWATIRENYPNLDMAFVGNHVVEGPAGTTVPHPFALRLTDPDGNPLRGVTVAWMLALLTLLTSFGTPWPHRRWRLAASTLFLGVVVWSVVYFVPTALMLSGPELDDIPPAQAIAETAQWVRLDDFRMLLVLAALACGARALYVPARG